MVNPLKIFNSMHALKRSILDCLFNCNKNVKESLIEVLLCMQFIRGLIDLDIRMKVLQGQQLWPIQDVNRVFS